jgi:hypothetical protein
MSDFIVNGPDVFTSLRKSMIDFHQQAPAILEQIQQAIEEVLIDLNKDQLETEGSLMEKSKELEKLKSKTTASQDSKSNENLSQNIKEEQDKQHEIERFKNYKQELIYAQENIKLMGQRVQQLKSELNNHVIGSSKGLQALTEFADIANRYLQSGSLSAPINTTSVGSNDAHRKGVISEISGNTMHVKELDNINQLNINNLIEEAENYNFYNNNKIKKVSISNVSQFYFNILEQNGFTIQELAPNDYSAYKEL